MTILVTIAKRFWMNLLTAGVFCLACVGCQPSASAQLDPTNEVSRVGTLAADDLNEASGLIESATHPGIFWTHNDGKDGVLFAVHRDGSFVARFKLDSKVEDWEDIARDDNGHLYVSDTGNNGHERGTVSVLELAEPDPADGNHKLATLRKWKLSFPEKPLDMEALVIRDGHGYLISKLDGGRRARMYRFELSNNRKQLLQPVATLPIIEPVTAADITADGKQLAVLAHGALYIFPINGDPATAENAKPQRIEIPHIKAEGCSFFSDGVLIVAESREVLLARLPANSTTQPAATHPAADNSSR